MKMITTLKRNSCEGISWNNITKIYRQQDALIVLLIVQMKYCFAIVIIQISI